MLPLAALSRLSGMGISSGTLSALTKNLDFDDILTIALRVALVGLLGAVVRGLFYRLKTSLSDVVFPTAHIPASDPAFEWVMAFLAQHEGVQNQLRSFRLHTADSRTSQRDEVNRNNRLKKQEGLAVSHTQASFMLGDVVGQVVPIHEQSVFVKHKGYWLWVERRDRGFAGSSSVREADHLRISGLAFQPNSIKELLVSAHQAFFKKADREILIFHVGPNHGGWLSPISRPVRTWKSVILPDAVKNDLLTDVREFMSDEEKEWYRAIGIPHRRGYLLHGRPGSGKTTLATAVASELKLDIYVVNPAARGMDDGKLNRAFRSCPPGNMILIEDIDCVMPPRPKSADATSPEEDDNDDAGSSGSPPPPEGDPGKFGLAKSTVTLSGLLNAIDGVSSQEDCVLFASTNHPERLDEALSRPGRFDVHIPFFDATHFQVLSLFKHFYPASMGTSNEKAGLDFTDADLDEKLSGLAERDGIDVLAQRFADQVFSTPVLADGSNLKVSMAALQGFLLKHKKDAGLAEQKVGEWVKEIWAGQQVKAEKRVERAKARDDEKERQRVIAAAGDKAAASEGLPKPNKDAKGEVELKTIEEVGEDQAKVAPPSPVSPVTAAAVPA